MLKTGLVVRVRGGSAVSFTKRTDVVFKGIELFRESRPWFCGLSILAKDAGDPEWRITPLENPRVPTSSSSHSRWKVLQKYLDLVVMSNTARYRPQTANRRSISPPNGQFLGRTVRATPGSS